VINAGLMLLESTETPVNAADASYYL